MKRSETYRRYAQNDIATGIVFLLIGVLWVIGVTIVSVLGVPMNIGWPLAVSPCLLFFGASAWSFFVEYRFDRGIQQGIEEEEAQEKQFSTSKTEEAQIKQ